MFYQKECSDIYTITCFPVSIKFYIINTLKRSSVDRFYSFFYDSEKTTENLHKNGKNTIRL